MIKKSQKYSEFLTPPNFPSLTRSLLREGGGGGKRDTGRGKIESNQLKSC
jgi:hypothetical protein